MSLASLRAAAAEIDVTALARRSSEARRRMLERIRAQHRSAVTAARSAPWSSIRAICGWTLWVRRSDRSDRRVDCVWTRGAQPTPHDAVIAGGTRRQALARVIETLTRGGARQRRWMRGPVLDGIDTWCERDRDLRRPPQWMAVGHYASHPSAEAAVAAAQARRASIRQRLEHEAALRPIVDSRWQDGTLRGVRAYGVLADGTLVSPHRGTRWERPALTAAAWSDSDALRRHDGIHAAWPTRGGLAPEEVRRPRSEIDARLSGADIAQGCECSAWAEVSGYGRCVVGDLGWRAEHCLIVRVMAPAAVREQIASRYPEVEVMGEA